ncbi:hypothetical protein ABIE93_008736 [Bradyrhizobium elkanii]
MHDRIETEQRREAEQRAAGLGIGGEESKHQHETQDAPDITGGPAGAREPPDPVGRHQGRHHRIVEDGRELDADACDRIGEQQHRDDVGIAGLADPHRARADHEQRAEAGNPWLAPAAGIGDCPEHRRQQRDRKSGSRGGKPPQRLAAGGIRRDKAREIRREHEGRDQREIRLRGPVEEDPADDGGAARIILGGGLRVTGARLHCCRHRERYSPTRTTGRLLPFQSAPI